MSERDLHMELALISEKGLIRCQTLFAERGQEGDRENNHISVDRKHTAI